MTRRITFLLIAAALVFGGRAVAAQDRENESFLGIVKTVSDASITIERGTTMHEFIITGRTHVAARGASSKTRANLAAGKPGLTVPDVLQVGDQVAVKYDVKDGYKVATDIQLRARVFNK